MVSQKYIQNQLKGIRVRFRFIGKAGVRELAHIITEGEQILHCIFGSYQGGTALIVATDQRLLIVDKKPLFLNLEDVRYHAMQDIQFSNGIFTASFKVVSGISTTEVKSLSISRLRNMCRYVQERVSASRGESVSVADITAHSQLVRAKASRYSGQVLTRRQATL